MIWIGLLALIINGYVGYIQVNNYRKFKDQNGKDKERILFIVQVFLMTNTVVSIMTWPPLGYVFLLILSVNSLSFYYNWDLYKFLRR